MGEAVCARRRADLPILATQFRSYWAAADHPADRAAAPSPGVVLGLLVSGNPLSLYTLYGVIALTGIAVNSAIVLIDAANEAPRRRHERVQHAAIYAARGAWCRSHHLHHHHRRVAVAGDRPGRQVADVGTGGGEHRGGWVFPRC